VKKRKALKERGLARRGRISAGKKRGRLRNKGQEEERSAECGQKVYSNPRRGGSRRSQQKLRSAAEKKPPLLHYWKGREVK